MKSNGKMKKGVDNNLKGVDNRVVKRDQLILDKLEGMSQRMNEMEGSPRQLQLSPRSQQLSAMPFNYTSSLAEKVSPIGRNLGRHDPQLSSYDHRTHEMEEMSFVITGLQAKLSDSQEEVKLIAMKLSTESKGRRKLEHRNAELNSKLSEARQGLRDTQSALQGVKQATDELSLKRDQRDLQLQQLLADNHTFQVKNTELDSKLRDCESSMKAIIQARDELVGTLQEQLTASKETCFKLQSDVVRCRSEKSLVDAEVEAFRRKVMAIEARAKLSNDSLTLSYQKEISTIEGKLRAMTDKAEEYKGYESQCDTLTQEVQCYRTNVKALEKSESEANKRVTVMESQIQKYESQIKKVESQVKDVNARLLSSEQGRTAADNELVLLKKKAIERSSPVEAKQAVKEVKKEVDAGTGEEGKIAVDDEGVVNKETSSGKKSATSSSSSAPVNFNSSKNVATTIVKTEGVDLPIPSLTVDAKEEISVGVTEGEGGLKPTPPAGEKPSVGTGSSPQRTSIAQIAVLQNKMADKVKVADASIKEFDESAAAVSSSVENASISQSASAADTREVQKDIEKEEQNDGIDLSEFDTGNLAADIGRIKKAKKKMKKEIAAWQKSFSVANSREPTTNEKLSCPGNLYHVYAKVNGLLKDKEGQN